MEFAQKVSFFLAFTAGFLTFLSPCILPLLPAYIFYLTGMTVGDYSQPLGRGIKRKVFFSSLLFVFGFSLVFILLGATATTIGRILIGYIGTIRKIAGLVVIFFGLHLLGVIKIKYLYYEKRANLRALSPKYLGPLLMGISFAAGWTPCIGPILSSILIYASTVETVRLGVLLLIFYSLGLALPFLIISLALGLFVGYLNKIKKYFRVISIISGGLLIIVGVLIFTNYLPKLTGILGQF